MRGVCRLVVASVVVWGALGSSAWAQYYYPPGYTRWGWGGWGGTGASTAQGDVARGLGAFAAGAGVYNEQTAVARSINADTAMRWNQYLWQSQQEANKRYHEKLAREQKGNVQAREEIYRRLRDNPEPGDVARGDALNVALDEITNPRVYYRGLKGAGVKVAGTTIRDIPFQKASAAITMSVDQLTEGGPPPSLKAPAFEPERAELRALAAQLRKQNEEKGQLDPATLARAREVIHALGQKVQKTLPAGSRGRLEAERFLKAAFGLTRMLESPAIDVLLAGVEKRPDTTLGDLLSFMTAFDLRFGPASTPRQREVYNELYPLLDRLRDEAAEVAPKAGPQEAGGVDRPIEFFDAMPLENLDPKNRDTPARPKGERD